jgi:transposase
LVYVDESGCDKRAGFRRTGWSPRGVTPVQISRFQRGQRYQILPAYSQDGVLLSRVFQGSTDADVFEDFIEQLLHHCGRWPEPNSVLLMDNASFHRSDRIQELCATAGVKLVYLPPYSPDLNPIEEFFSELKGFVRRNWVNHVEDFKDFLEWCVDVVGSRGDSAKGHFRHAGVVVEDYPLRYIRGTRAFRLIWTKPSHSLKNKRSFLPAVRSFMVIETENTASWTDVYYF